MDEFKPQQVPDPIISPGQKLPPLSLPADDQSAGRFSAVKEFYSNNKWYVWAIVAGISIIGVLMFFALRPQKPEPLKEANVDVKITSSDTAPSGGEVIYKMIVQNNDTAKLVDMELEMVYAEGVSYVSSTPSAENLSGTRFKVPNLGNGQNAALIVKTVAQGNVNDEKKLVVKLRYRYENFNSEFVKETTHTVRLIASDVILDVTGPENATNSEVVKYDVFYRNNSDKEIDDARIKIHYPEGFAFADSTPKPSQENNVWRLDTLKQQGTGKISFQGSFKSANPGQAATFKVDFEVVDDKGNFFTQGSTTYLTTISSLPLLVEQKVSNTNANKIFKPGDVVSYDVTFQNNNTVVATGVTIVLNIDSNAVDFATIKAEAGSVQDGNITWNGSSVASLSRLNPNEKGSVKFSYQIKNPAVKDSSENLTAVTKIKIKSNEVSTFQDGNDETIKVSSPSSLKGAVAHVSGQLPPKVGQPSTFKVTLELRNASNDYGSSVLTGFIPVGVNMVAGTVTAKESALVKYDAATGKVTWNAGILDAHSGTVNPVRTLEFDVTFTPSAAQKGKAVELFKNISFTGKDTHTAQTVTLTTQLLGSDSIPGKSNSGKVTE